MVHGPEAGLELLTALDSDPRLSGHYRLDAVRAHLFEMAGDRHRALEHYRAAAERTSSMPERDYLTGKAARLAARPTDSSNRPEVPNARRAGTPVGIPALLYPPSRAGYQR